jgi:hypothetical protein
MEADGQPAGLLRGVARSGVPLLRAVDADDHAVEL